jgi:hypothetical protein
LTGHLACRHLTALDVEPRGTRSKPKVWDPVLELLAERGALHEASYLDLTNLKRWHADVSARPSASA